MRITTIAVAIGAALITSQASAQPVGASLDPQAAQTIIAGCVVHSTAKKQSHAVAVVDTGGKLVAALRMAGNGYGIVDFVLAKAEAAAAWGFGTAQMAEGARETPGFGVAPHVVTVPGGFPIWSTDGKTRIGAVGVSGEAPADDAACAEAGIRAAGMRSSRAN